MSELSPERQQLLKQALDIQERMLEACVEVFRGLSHHPDAEVSSVSEYCLTTIEENRAVLDALIDGLTATKH